MKTETVSVANEPYTEAELIKSVFQNNESLLKTIRSLFFGLELDKKEKELIYSTFKNKNLVSIFTRRFMPTLNKEAGIGQTLDLWAGVDVRNLSRDAIHQQVYGRDMLIKHTKQALSLLENPDGDKVNLEFDPTFSADPLFVKLIARNTFLNHVETQLGIIKLIAEQANETVEETKKRLLKNSNK